MGIDRKWDLTQLTAVGVERPVQKFIVPEDKNKIALRVSIHGIDASTNDKKSSACEHVGLRTPAVHLVHCVSNNDIARYLLLRTL